MFLLKPSSLLSKSILLATLTCFSLVAKLSAVNLLNSAEVIYLAQSRILFFVLRTVVVTKLLAHAILF